MTIIESELKYEAQIDVENAGQKLSMDVDFIPTEMPTQIQLIVKWDERWFSKRLPFQSSMQLRLLIFFY